VSADDVVLSAADGAALLKAEVVVEEKLDGMNVMLWFHAGAPRVGTRGGEHTSDRSGERGRIRAWASMRSDSLAVCLHDRFVVYGEWLRRRHAVPYDRLPGQLIGFDILDRRTGDFIGMDRRDTLLAELGIANPPARFRGSLGSTATLHKLLGPSAFADAQAEGLVIRTVDGRPPRVAKYLDPAWHGIGSTPWAGENHLDTSAQPRS
jgi:RNA ligase